MSKELLELKRIINEKKKYLAEEKGKLQILNQQYKEKVDEKERLENDNNKLLTIKGLVEKSSSEARENGRQLLEQVLSASIQTVFGENTEAKLNPDLKDGIPTLNVSILKHVNEGTIIIDPTEADGGGLADIVALASFMGLGQLLEKNFAPYVLDEPTKYVSEGNKAVNSAEFVKNMVQFTGKQTIVATHDKALMTKRDKGYKLIIDEDTGETNVYEDSNSNSEE